MLIMSVERKGQKMLSTNIDEILCLKENIYSLLYYWSYEINKMTRISHQILYIGTWKHKRIQDKEITIISINMKYFHYKIMFFRATEYIYMSFIP